MHNLTSTFAKNAEKTYAHCLTAKSSPINGETLLLQKYLTGVKIHVISWKSKIIKKSDTSLCALLIYISFDHICLYLYKIATNST